MTPYRSSREDTGSVGLSSPRVLVVAGVASGVGKTTVALGLLEAFRRRGLTVQAFKVGPDFIDPGFHELITGRPSYNLDGWMCGRDHVLTTVAREAADVDLVVIEGVMGCFDGFEGSSDEGSTAQLAKWLRAPVVLVVDVKAQSRSAAAVVLGFERFDPGLNVAAVIANRVGGDTHRQCIEEAIATTCRAVLLGAIKRDDRLALPERHLGLVTAVEGVLTAGRRAHLAETLEASVDLDRVLALAAPLRSAPRIAAPSIARPRARIGVARDAAFQFYYADNLNGLREAGAELVFWSPLMDDALPNVDGLYLGGGYPELHARVLSDNVGVRKAVRELVLAGRPVYAECGGLMYLADALQDLDGVEYPMVGVLPATVRMRPRKLSLGYAEVSFTADTPLGAAGTVARGHEFHYSTLDPVPESVARAWRVVKRRGGGCDEGYALGRALMSYVHLHFASCPEIPRRFVEACVEAKQGVQAPVLGPA
jgi:cobyrinic acid a,c-diamide synthase